MITKPSLCLALSGVLFLILVGCRSHPELSKTNDKGSNEWRGISGSPASSFEIKAGNRIDTPGGEKVLSLGVFCDTAFLGLRAGVSSGDIEPESGHVSVGFDDNVAQKNWTVESTPLKGRVFYNISPPDEDKADFIRQLKSDKNFLFEFTPKGGKPQRSKFKLLNIGTLMDQDANCQAVSKHAQ